MRRYSAGWLEFRRWRAVRLLEKIGPMTQIQKLRLIGGPYNGLPYAVSPERPLAIGVELFVGDGSDGFRDVYVVYHRSIRGTLLARYERRIPEVEYSQLKLKAEHENR
jgi:hypothetical protein